MADEVTPMAPVDAQPTVAAAEPSTEPIQADAETTTITKEDEDSAGKQATTEVNAPDGDTTEVADGPLMAETATDATPATGKKEKRKSVSGVPEHKNKKLNRKKSMPTLHLDCQPGEHYWARLKGYPPWPAIICDEQMLPESLLGSRPVSTTRPDGTLRDDFKEGGKNAKERTFPVMFLATNEFSWLVNTGLTPLDPAECTEKPKAKMTKALTQAYQLASESHDLEYYKGVLADWQTDMQAIAKEQAERDAADARLAEEAAAREAEEAAAEEEEDSKEKKKKKPRKSKGGDDDVEMEDAEAPKSSKKRKKEVGSDADGDKPRKTPKMMLKAPKTPNGETPTTKKAAAAKPKKKVTAPKAEEAEEEEKPQMTEAERMAQREKAVLYLRHRLQKGFLSRDQAPQESEMSAMADFFTQLEGYENLEPSIIRTTKIHKVLKAIVKLVSIPKDEEFNFKKRSSAMLEVWNKRMEADSEAAAPASATEAKAAGVEEAPATNGDVAPAPEAVKAEAPAVADGADEAEAKKGAEQAVEEKGAEKAADEADAKIEAKAVEKADEDATMQDLKEPAEAPVEKDVETALGNDAKDEAEVGDISMQTAPEETAPAAEAA